MKLPAYVTILTVPKKYYVVWQGRKPGIYDNWEDCSKQVKGFPNAKYQSFPDKQQANDAFNNISKTPNLENFIKESICVDAACSGNPGRLEYRLVDTQTREEIFRKKAISLGTNNLGEFLAIVHALAMLKKENRSLPIYSDSLTAIEWVNKKEVRSKLPRDHESEEVWELVDRALDWLRKNQYTSRILHWNTKGWGQIPADFNRK